MDRANCTRNCYVSGAHSLIVVLALLALLLIDSCSRPANQDPARPAKAAMSAAQSAPSQPVPEAQPPAAAPIAVLAPAPGDVPIPADAHRLDEILQCGDRKSTRLNSSHVEISYAVFCLKKK